MHWSYEEVMDSGGPRDTCPCLPCKERRSLGVLLQEQRVEGWLHAALSRLTDGSEEARIAPPIRSYLRHEQTDATELRTAVVSLLNDR